MSKILIRNIFLNNHTTDILIEGNRISLISDNIQARDAQILDGTGMAVIPGFANMHTHAAMTMMRGSQEDARLHKWLGEIWKMETRLDDELVYWGTKLACV